MSSKQPTSRTRVRRHPERGVYEQRRIYSIIDEALVAHVGYVENGQPRVTPTLHVRVDDTLYLHGANSSHTLRVLKKGVGVCVECTIVDGLVLARSALKHSMNYRSVVVYGVSYEVTQLSDKRVVLDALMEHVIPGRLASIRRPDAKELKQTAVVALPLTESSAKIREGGPNDLEGDLSVPAWAGVVPLSLVPGVPIPDANCTWAGPTPDHIRQYGRSNGSRESG